MFRNVLRLFWISLFPLLLMTTSCTQKRVALPVFQGGDIHAALAEKRAVTDIETTFSISLGRSDEISGADMRGDGALTISDSGDLDLRIYTLGFLAMELTARDGLVRGSPGLETTKKLLLTEGLRQCIFWWKLGDFVITEESGTYLLRNGNRRVWVDEKSFLPLRQIVFLDDGKQLNIYYEEPVQENNRWYQSRIRIEFLQYALSLSIKTLEVKPAEAACSYCSL
ncbi:MAG: hypothetical protein C0402_06005 [Thermodesulfovibrio sp.]|nr:hypothetical protein [Thermodesulfovibrio sp.]